MILICTRRQLSAEFLTERQAAGYFDNDSGQFAPPHEAAEDTAHVTAASLMDSLRSLPKADEVNG